MNGQKNGRARAVSNLSLATLAVLIFGVGAEVSVAQVNTSANTTMERLSTSFGEVSRQVMPSVVSIETKGRVQEIALKENGSGAGKGSGSGGGSGSGSVDDLMEFLRRQARRPTASVGSGFIVDKSGYILTNLHVVSDASKIKVRLQSGEEFLATVVGGDDETDLAVLKIDAARDLPFVKIGNSDAAQVGDWVVAIGSPFGLARTVTAGIISQTRRETPYATPFQKFIQTDAAINRGNSGGPLVNMNGEVIGVNSQIATSNGDFSGVGFALPSNEALNVYRQIVQTGKVRRGYLGVILESVKVEFAKVYGLGEAKGAIVIEIRDISGPAAKAGLKADDIVVEFNNLPVTSAQDLIEKVAGTLPDQTVSLAFLRDNGTVLERKTVSIKLGERPANSFTGDDGSQKKLPVDGKKMTEPFGIKVGEFTPEIAATYKLEGEKGVVIKEIDPASFIADLKHSSGADALNEGDVIQRINRVRVTDTKTFNDVAANLKKGDAVVLHILSYNRLTQTTTARIVQFTVQ